MKPQIPLLNLELLFFLVEKHQVLGVFINVHNRAFNPWTSSKGVDGVTDFEAVVGVVGGNGPDPGPMDVLGEELRAVRPTVQWRKGLVLNREVVVFGGMWAEHGGGVVGSIGGDAGGGGGGGGVGMVVWLCHFHLVAFPEWGLWVWHCEWALWERERESQRSQGRERESLWHCGGRQVHFSNKRMMVCIPWRHIRTCTFHSILFFQGFQIKKKKLKF